MRRLAEFEAVQPASNDSEHRFDEIRADDMLALSAVPR
jgi:hypothetical protein